MLLVFFALSVVASAQEGVEKSVSIKNFGQMDERFYRGAQPKEEEFKELAALGIRTVIDLRDDPKETEKGIVESLGMRYVNIPMTGKKYPTEEAVRQFLKVVNDPATGSFFVHCAGGRHRTGAMGAVYRYTKYGWNFEQVYAEMKKYDFYTSWGHGAFKDFVQDYYERMQASKATADAAPVNTVAASVAPANTVAVSTTAPAKAATASVTVDAIPTTDSITSQR
jgi:protein tyrosine phosphatase (PTP) superfamily phosphohydrolase (DUF442 family)